MLLDFGVFLLVLFFPFWKLFSEYLHLQAHVPIRCVTVRYCKFRTVNKRVSITMISSNDFHFT